MRKGLDFDRVLFRTDEFKKHLFDRFEKFEETYEDAKINGVYRPEKHAELMDVDVSEIFDELHHAEDFLYEDVDELEKIDHELVIVSRGDIVYQKELIRSSGVLEYVDDFFVVEDKSKDSVDIDLLVDDWEKELERVDVPVFHFDRDKHSVEDIIRRIKIEDVFKRYDVRGVYPEEIDEEFAERMGKAVGSFAVRSFNGKVVVTRDTKQSSAELKGAISRGIKSTGCTVIDEGIGPTDYTAITGSNQNAIGVQVTSSHLPLNFNGFKFLYPEGNGFLNDDLENLKQIFRTEEFEEGEGRLVEKEEDMKELYRRKVTDFVQNLNLDFNGKIALDTMGGAAGELLSDILEDLGMKVREIDEGLRDPPNPDPDNLETLSELCERNGMTGIATDMDGDRLAVYDDGFLEGDELLSIFSKLFSKDVVVSIDTAEMLEDSVERNVHYTRVGDPFVMDEAIKRDADFAGEPNGHYAFPEIVPYHSGTLAGVIVAGVDLEKLREELNEFEILEESIEVENKRLAMERIAEEVENRYSVLSRIDGVKFRKNDSTALVRSSGTSPKIRIKVSSRNSKEAEDLMEELEEVIRNQ